MTSYDPNLLRMREEWTASKLAALERDGVPRRDIRIRLHADLAITILVRGKPVYEWTKQ
jgi:hypothetical protein